MKEIIKKSEDLTEFEMSMIRKRVEEERQLRKERGRLQIKWETEATQVIREKLEARRAKNLPNDWKIGFYELKLEFKPKIIEKLKNLIG